MIVTAIVLASPSAKASTASCIVSLFSTVDSVLRAVAPGATFACGADFGKPSCLVFVETRGAA